MIFWFLQACEYKPKETFEAIEENFKWKVENIPPLITSLTEMCIVSFHHLELGVYVCSRKRQVLLTLHRVQSCITLTFELWSLNPFWWSFMSLHSDYRVRHQQLLFAGADWKLGFNHERWLIECLGSWLKTA